MTSHIDQGAVKTVPGADITFRRTVDLAGMGDRADAEGPFTLDRYADEVGKVADLLAKPMFANQIALAAPVPGEPEVSEVRAGAADSRR
jgi:hypothetical protein